MTQETPTYVYVCRTCKPEGFAGEQDERPGAKFCTQLADLVRERAIDDGRVILKAVDCLSVCKRPCTVSVVGAGKFAYVIGDLDPDTDCNDVLDFALIYGEAPDGITKWRDRPEKIRKSTIARVPPSGHIEGPVCDIAGTEPAKT